MITIPIWVFVLSLILSFCFLALLFGIMWIYVLIHKKERKEFAEYFDEYYKEQEKKYGTQQSKDTK